MNSKEYIKLIFRAMSNFDITGEEASSFLISHFKTKNENSFFQGLFIGLIAGTAIIMIYYSL